MNILPVTIHIEAASAGEARAEMQALLAGTVTSVWRVSPAVPVESVIAKPADEPAAAPEAPAAPEAKAPAKRGRPPKADAPAAAVETAAAAPAPEEAAQDFLDETPAKTKPATRDDVRNAMMDYSAKYGMPAAQADGPKILGFPKLSAIPDTADFASLVAAMKRATETNPYDRAVVPVEAAAA